MLNRLVCSATDLLTWRFECGFGRFRDLSECLSCSGPFCYGLVTSTRSEPLTGYSLFHGESYGPNVNLEVVSHLPAIYVNDLQDDRPREEVLQT